MPRFYKGIGVGTFLHAIDLRSHGIVARGPGITYSASGVMAHIARGTTTSPCISLTRSYGVAEIYAKQAGRAFPSATSPAYVYGIDLDDPLPVGVTIRDPLVEILSAFPDPLAHSSYHHDGDVNFLLGVVNPTLMPAYLNTPILQPPGSGGAQRPANLTLALEAMVRALRDAEVLAVGTIPASCVVERHDVL